VEIELVTGEPGERRTSEVWRLYDRIFGDQPDESTWRQAVWDRHVAREGFRLVIAYDAQAPVGFGYGYTGSHGQWWTDRAAEVLTAGGAAEWLGGHFELVSIGVVPEARGRGVGAALLQRLTAGLPHERWLLMTTAAAEDPARRLYARQGWEVIGPGLSPDTVIMGRRRDPLAVMKERAHDQLAPIDAAYQAGEIDETEWHARVLQIVEPAYLSASTPQAQSGHGGDAARWEHARRLLLDAVDRPGTFLDVGCANGLLMESVAAWSAEDGIPVEPYGIDISARLVELARRRCPRWADRIWAGNAFGWSPPQRFDLVRTGPDYVPPGRLGDYLAHLLKEVVAPGGRLVVGTYNEERDRDTVADQVRSMGFSISGSTQRSHRHPALAYKAVWIDR
jgi:ribosomal protein S18 acetylase RimI-like enzyme/SAM-dependent methyltransferase